jgi:hypothetical protein
LAVVLLLCVGVVAGLYYLSKPPLSTGPTSSVSAEQQYQSQCGSYALMMVSDLYSDGHLFSTWYNCSGGSVTFDISGSIVGSNPTNGGDAGGSISASGLSVPSHQTTSTAVSATTQYPDEPVVSVQFFAVDPSSPADVLSSAYSLQVVNTA